MTCLHKIEKQLLAKFKLVSNGAWLVLTNQPMSLSNRSGRLLSASANPGAHPATTAKYSLAATRTCRPKTDSIDGLSGSGAVTQALNTAVTVQRTPRTPFLTYSLPLIFAKVIPVPTRPCPSSLPPDSSCPSHNSLIHSITILHIPTQNVNLRRSFNGPTER